MFGKVKEIALPSSCEPTKTFQHNFSGAFLLYYTAVFMSGSKSLLGMDFISKVHYFSSACFLTFHHFQKLLAQPSSCHLKCNMGIRVGFPKMNFMSNVYGQFLHNILNSVLVQKSILTFC